MGEQRLRRAPTSSGREQLRRAGRAVRPRDGPRRCSTRASPSASSAMLDGGAVEEVEQALERGASRTARKAIGFEEIAAHLRGRASSRARRRERIERRHRQYVKRQLTWMRKLAGVELIDRTGARRAAHGRRRSLERLDSVPAESAWGMPLREVAGARQRLHDRRAGCASVRADAGARAAHLRAHFGCHSDGVLLLSEPTDERFAARLRIFNPDGSEAELSGNGAREAILYLHRHGWTEQRRRSRSRRPPARSRPTILDERTCAVEMGRARLQSRRLPSGGPDGRGDARGRRAGASSSSTSTSATRSA